MKKTITIFALISLILVAAATIILWGYDTSTKIVHACPGSTTCDGVYNTPTNLTALWIILGMLGAAGVILLAIKIRSIRANKDYKKRQKKKQMKRKARE